MIQVRVGPLVRAVSAESAAVWCEWTEAGEVELVAVPEQAAQEQIAMPLTRSTRARTICVGGHHYTLFHLTGLQPASWYAYTLAPISVSGEPAAVASSSFPSPGQRLIQCFRTLDLPGEGQPLRVAYGSCRNLSAPGPDALSAFGTWLQTTFDERETLWPRLLLLIGDQIYADEGLRRRKKAANSDQRKPVKSALPPGAHSFEEFTALYEEAWMEDAGVRQALAALPTYMIFDDHEITNSWNIAPSWLGQALRRGLEQTLVDGLVAYWLYQGWGNLCARSASEHPLLALMQQAAQSGEDALEELRDRVRKAVYGEIMPHWHYEIPTTPPIFVADVRADRPAFRGKTEAAALDAPARIMSQPQMEELRRWLQTHASTAVLLVSSVPALLPPAIGFAEYMAGIRPLRRGPLRQPAHLLATLQRQLAQYMSFDHWPVFSDTWHELVDLLAARQRDLIILSGDVHFSYAAQARTTLFPTKKRATLYQLVASPFRNALSKGNSDLIRGQSTLKRFFFGGLHIAILPLLRPWGAKHIPHDLLMQNTIALLTLWPQSSEGGDTGNYRLQQIYMGIKDGRLREVARTAFEYRE